MDTPEPQTEQPAPDVTTSSRGRRHQGTDRIGLALVLLSFSDGGSEAALPPFHWELSAVPTKIALSCEVTVVSKAYVEFV
jgi:hypothetical protein